MVDLATMDQAKKARYYEYLKLKEMESAEVPDDGKMSYEEASKGDVAAELARSGGRGFMEATVELAGDFGDIVVDPIRDAYNAPEGGKLGAFGSSLLREVNPFDQTKGRSEQARHDLMYDNDLYRGMTEQKIRTGDNELLDAGKTGLEWAAGSVGPGRAKDIAKLAAATGIGAGAGEYAGGTVGEIVGGIASGLGAPQAVAKKVIRLMDRFKNKFQLSDSEAVARATEYLRKNSDDWEGAINKLENAIDEGEIGSFAELTGDRRLANVEAGPQKGSPTRQKFDELTQQRGEQTIEQFSEGFGPQTMAPGASEVARSRVDQELLDLDVSTGTRLDEIDQAFEPRMAEIEDAAALATREAEQATTTAEGLEQITTSGTQPSVASARVAKGVETLDKHLKKKYQDPAWKKFDDASLMDAETVKKTLENATDELMHGTMKEDVEGSFGGVYRLINKWEGNVRPSELHYVVSKIKAINAQQINMNGKLLPQNKALGQVGTAIEKQLKQAGADGDLYRDAITATRQRFDRTRQGVVADIGDEAQTFGKELLQNLESGAVSADDILATESPAIIKRVEEYIRSVARRDGVDTVVKKYDEFLQRFPNLRREFQDVIESQGEASVLTETAKSRASEAKGELKVLRESQEKATAQVGEESAGLKESINQSVRNEYAKQPTKTITRLLNDADEGADQLSQLVDTAGDAAGVRRDVGNAVEEMITGSRAGKQTIDYGAITNFQKIRPKLEGIFSPDELNKMQDTLERTRTSDYQKLAAPQKISRADSEMSNLYSSIAAASVVGTLPGTQSLLVGGAVRRFFKNHMFSRNKVIDPAVERVLDEIMLDPAKHIDDLIRNKITTQKEYDVFLNTMRATYASGQETE